MRKKHFVGAGLGIAVLVAGVFGMAQGSSAQTGDSGVLDQQQAEAVYRELATSFPLDLPEGSVLPQARSLGGAAATKARSAGADVAYERGAVEAQAYFFWQCAWMETALANAGGVNEGLESEALVELSKWPSTSFYKSYVEEAGGSWVQDVLVPAQAGEYDAMAASYAAGCVASNGTTRSN